MEQKAIDVLDDESHSLDVVVIGGDEPKLYVHAWGLFPTSGWRDGRLVPWSTAVKPDDGIYDFDLVAKSPEGIVLQVLTPIPVSMTFRCPAGIHGVRIHGSQGSKEKFVRVPSSGASGARVLISRGDDFVPIPVLAIGGADIGG